MRIAAYNPDTDDLEKTYISAYQAKGVTTLPVKNNDRFINLRRILIGRMGDERAELNTLSSIAADKLSIGVAATKFGHNADDPVYLLDYDQIKFFKAPSIAGTYTLQSTMDVDVDNSDGVTVWDDTANLSGDYYCYSYFNSVTLEESVRSDPMKPGGFDLLTIGNVIDQSVRRLRDTSFTVLGQQEYLDIAQTVNDDLITQARRPYGFLHREGVLLNTIAGQNYIDFPDKLWKYDYVTVATTLGAYRDFKEVTPLTLEQFNNRYDNSQVLNQDNILEVAVDQDNSRLMIYPTPKTSQTGVAKVAYWKAFDPIQTLGQVIETPNGLIYRAKFMAEHYSAKSETDRQWDKLAVKYETVYGNEVVKMQRTNRMDAGTPRSFMPNKYYRRRRYHL